MDTISSPCKTKTPQETERSLRKFLEPSEKAKVIHTDNSLHFGKSCEELSWNHCTSTLHGSESNGIAGRAECRIKEGTSVVLLQSGLGEKWWANSMECYCCLRDVQEDLLADGRTLSERRFGEPFLKARSFRSAQWLNSILSLRKTSQGSINVGSKFYLAYSSDMHCLREEFGKETFWLRTLKSWKIWTRQKSMLEDPMGRT